MSHWGLGGVQKKVDIKQGRAGHVTISRTKRPNSLLTNGRHELHFLHSRTEDRAAPDRRVVKLTEQITDLPRTSAAIKELATELVCHLKRKMKNTQPPRENWTNQNKRVLEAFFCDRGCHCDFTGSQTGGEFLWDFAAYINFKGMLLVAESEFDTDHEEIAKDFDKLLYSNAPLRLMMCRIDKSEQAAKAEAGQIQAELKANVQQNCTNYSGGDVIIVYCVWWALEGGKNRDFAYLLQIDGEPNYRDAVGKSFEAIGCGL